MLTTPEIKALPGGFIAVSGLTEHTSDHHVFNDPDRPYLYYFDSWKDTIGTYRIYLEKGNYTILGWSDQPEVAEQVVERSRHYGDLYRSYDPNDVRLFSYATESLSSLLRSLGIEDKVLMLRKD